jgi:hypothetical protein
LPRKQINTLRVEVGRIRAPGRELSKAKVVARFVSLDRFRDAGLQLPKAIRLNQIRLTKPNKDRRIQRPVFTEVGPGGRASKALVHRGCAQVIADSLLAIKGAPGKADYWPLSGNLC